ncbi:unnamed protein product [Rotaria magnacalcarata]|uniref:Integrase catalytic domain-containing protein n=1 Tax=Rotaria magnacalcarata TaxID=392030 RepID=A0A820DV30_9BILA|nr:unnamed protein product [Rotaria magnacalcarata]CAF4238421.1 unnamed protein product [Rotaria magnacalcarata]
MMDKKILNKRVEKISLLLQEFNIIKIIHVQGKHNCLPDYLSRHPISYEDELLDSEYGLGFQRDKSSSVQFIGAMVTRSKTRAASTNVSSSSSQQPQSSSDTSSSSTPVTTSSSSTIDHFDITQLQEHQNNDIQIQKIVNDLQHNPHISFELNDGILYKSQSSSHGKVKRKLIYVPSSMVNSLLVSYHDNPFLGGHFAIRRTLHKLQQQYWRPNMKHSVIDHIKFCIVCQAYNTSRQKRPGFLHPVRPPDGANELLGIDFCGSFPPTPTDNRYVLCLTDYYTKFVTTIPLSTCSAQVTAEAIFKEHICRFGLLGYHYIFCTPYHPQSNGQVERLNSTFVTQLAKLTDQEHNNWDEHLYPIVFAYNTGMHSTTNFTPFELTFGRPANLPTDRPPTTFTFSSPHDYLDQLVRNLKYYHTTVRQRIKQQHAQSKIRYDRRRSDPQYDLGTMVLTRIFTNRSKLDPRFSLDPKIIVNRQHPIY